MTLLVTPDSSVKLWTDGKYRIGKMRKETVASQMPEGTDENHETAVVMVGNPLKLKMRTSRTHVRSAAACSTAIGRT